MFSKFWTGDKLMSISALIVSLCTLTVFIYQTNLIRKQQFMSVYPHLMLTNQESGSISYKYMLYNQGIGPAMIKEIKIYTLDGTEYESLSEYIGSRLSEKDSIWVYVSDIFPGRFVPAKSEIPLIGMYDEGAVKSQDLPPNTLKGARKLYGIINNDSLQFEVKYESIYGEQWLVTGDYPIPKKLE